MFKYILFLWLVLATTLYAEESENNISDEVSFFTKDGDLDLSEYMSQAYGFLPVPIIITEPSVGYGGGFSLIYLHDTLTGKKSHTGRRIPPSISGAIIAKTENGTETLGLFHIGYWLEDTLRTATYVGKPDVFIDMYGDDFSFNMHFDGILFYQSVKKRVMESHLFLGVAYMYIDTDVTFDFEKFEEDFSGKSTVGSFSLLAEYDSRDNQLSPNNGQYLTFRTEFYDESLGGDYHFSRYKSTNLFYNAINSKMNLDFNVVAEGIKGDESEIPSYMYPYISMRGVPILRYQGEKIVTVQSQYSYNFTEKWKGLVFAGIGRAFGKQIIGSEYSFDEAPNRVAGGIGFRYLIAEKFGLRIGVDLAKSEEDEAFYIQIGTAWKGF